jgi:hypothetical protein
MWVSHAAIGVSWQPREHPATQPHEYVRGGTTTLFAAFNVLDGRV